VTTSFRLMTAVIIAGATLGALFGPPTHPGDANPLAQCAEAMPLRELLVYALTTPSDCVGSAFGRGIGLGRAMFGALGGAGLAAAAVWAAGWLQHPRTPLPPNAAEAALRTRCLDVAATAAEIERDRARGWAIVPLQAERHRQAVETLQDSLRVVRPDRARAILGDVLGHRPELAAIVLATHRQPPTARHAFAHAVVVFACAALVFWVATALLAP